ncbi:MAG TPA: CapA family protein [Myxococcales bacterium]|nr:CapA family protein [Myxococcales bacterium]
MLAALLALFLSAPPALPCRCAATLPPLAPGAPAPKVLASLTLAATGDVMMHEAVKDAAAAQDVRVKGASTNHDGFDGLFSAVAPELHRVDLAFGNLEFPVAPKAGRGTKPFVFNAPPIVLAAVKAAGFGVVSCANNHAFDQGRAGVAETVANVLAAGLQEVGAGRDRAEAERVVYLEVHGIRLAFIGFTARFNQNLDVDDPKAPRVAPADPAEMTAAIAAARKQADFVIVSIHWGTEYAKVPDPGEAELAHALVDAGAGLILGSHPHVLQPLELYPAADGRVALVAYSLGNFISNQSRLYAPGVNPDSQADTRDGVLLEVTLEKRQYAAGPPRVELGPVTLVPLWTDNNALARQRNAKLPTQIHVVPIDATVARAQGELATALAAKIPDAAVVARLQRRIAFLLEQRARIADRLGAQFTELAPATPAAP